MAITAHENPPQKDCWGVQVHEYKDRNMRITAWEQ